MQEDLLPQLEHHVQKTVLPPCRDGPVASGSPMRLGEGERLVGENLVFILFSALTSCRWLHAHLRSLLLLPVFWQERVCDDWVAVPVLWDQHCRLECSGCDHGGAVSYQPEVSSSLSFPLGVVWTSLAKSLPVPRSSVTAILVFLVFHEPSIS